uniref:Uncharacterized protein n=1 Tax=Trypanosoma congolense (strain IL3000) TaxID=1068625 RepID=G0V058_TRYCI|nr:conserved hypothetical protein [Trypanosoma congolense IL3000]
MSGAPFIPELSLGSVETGGGWGVGEQFARLPPAALQAQSRLQVYTVAAAADGEQDRDQESEESLVDSCSSLDDGSRSHDNETNSVAGGPAKFNEGAGEPPAAENSVPTTHYATVSADDDDTFVDHGSSVHLPPRQREVSNDVSSVKNAVKTTIIPPPAPEHVKFLHPVSRMSFTQVVRAMVVAPDNASLFVAVDDDPVTLLDFKGAQLEVNRELDVTHVHAMAVVRVPAAKLVTFKTSPKHRNARNHPAASTAAKAQADNGVEGEDTYVLWCGVSRGTVVIVDLSDYSVAGVLRNAHSQTITGVWYLGCGKVVTAGKDKALKVWDPQARRCTKSRNIATIISSVVYVSTRKHVWAISNDNYIRVFDSAGNNVRVHNQSNDKGENMISMKGEMRFIKYYEAGDLIYVAMPRTLAVVDPGTGAVSSFVELNLSSMSFLDNRALVTGYGGLLQCNRETIALLDLSDPLAPSVLFRGIGLNGSVTSARAQLLTGVPFAVISQKEGRSDRYLSVFNYEDTKALCKNGQPVVIPQQRKVTVEAPSNRRQQVVTAQNVAVPLPPPSVSSPSAAAPNNQSFMSYCNPVVFATDKRAALVREESSSSNACNQRPSAVVPSRVESSGFYNGSHVHSNVYAGNISRSGNDYNAANRAPPMLMTTPPELMASLSNIEKQTEDLKALFAHSRTSRPLLDDLSKLHNLVSRLAINDQLGPPIDSATLNSIEREYQSHEGRVIATAVERLRLSIIAAAGERAGSSSYGRRQGASRGPANTVSAVSGRPSPSPRLDLEKLRESVRDSSNSYSRTEDPTSVSCSELQSESLLRWVVQLTRSGQGERDSHRRQLESLERHNARIVERNAAFVSGIARMEQALRTQTQRLLEEIDASTAYTAETGWDSSNPTFSNCHIQSLNQALQKVRQVSMSSSPKEIVDAIGDLIELNSRLLSAQQYAHEEGGRRSVRPDTASCVASERDNYGSPTRASCSRDRFRNNAASTCVTTCTRSPPSNSPFVALRPQRVMAMIDEEVAAVETFVKEVGKFWCCLGETQKVIYLPYEDGQKPDLSQDFMQYAVLWHLRRSQVMIDVCRKESIIVIAEALFADFNDCQDPADKSGGDTGGLSLRGERLNGPSGSLGNSGVRKGNAAMEFSSVNSSVRCNTASLVSISLELESIASRMRNSREYLQWTLPSGVCKEAAGGFSVISEEKFYLHLTKLHGFLFWSRVALHLLFECLGCLNDLVFHSDEQPRSFHKDNFKAMEQQVDDWYSFLRELDNEYAQLCSVLTVSQRDGVSNHSTRPLSQRLSEQAGTSYPRERSQAGDGLVPTGVERRMQWLILFGIYIQRAGRGDTIPPLLVSNDNRGSMNAPDYDLMSVLDEIAQRAEAMRTKTTTLLCYCRKIQSRFVRLVEEAVVNEEVGQVFIPLWRGGPIAERNSKIFSQNKE